MIYSFDTNIFIEMERNYPREDTTSRDLLIDLWVKPCAFFYQVKTSIQG
jgi:hypothetical protein